MGPTADGEGSPLDADPRYALLVSRLADRLRPACPEWDDVVFSALVHSIAQMKVRWGDAYRTDPTMPALPMADSSSAEQGREPRVDR
jgi:hypothetical protein